MLKWRHMAAIAATAVLSATLGACASGAKPANMIVSTTDAPSAQPGQRGYKEFRVGGVVGGSKTNPMWMSNVDDAAFQTALEASLRQTNYLAEDPSQAKGEISATMERLDRPLAGLDFTVASTVDYKASLNGAPVLEDKVGAVGVGHFADNLIGVERLRIANEASIRENIEEFIRRLNAALNPK